MSSILTGGNGVLVLTNNKMDEYKLAELSPEEGKKLVEELQEVLKKYNAEMSVSSNLHILQRVPIEKKEEVTDAEVVTKVEDGN